MEGDFTLKWVIISIDNWVIQIHLTKASQWRHSQTLPFISTHPYRGIQTFAIYNLSLTFLTVHTVKQSLQPARPL